MRIGIVCPYSLTVPGGVQMQVLGLARALQGKGYNTRVLGPCDGPPPDAGVTPLGSSMPTISNGSMAPVAPDPACQLRTMRAIRDEAFDVIHLHEPLVPGPTMTALLTRPAPLLGTFHAASNSPLYGLMPRVARFFASRLDYRTAVSPDASATAYNVFGGDYDLLYNGLELSVFRSPTPETTMTTAPTVVFIGRHEPRKGLSVLLDAFKRMPDTTRLWIAGNGPETSRLQSVHAASGDRIEWLGTITDAEKIARLKGADVFCAPSLRGESFGIVLLEAMAAGAAVVASNLPGYRNVAQDGVNALLVEPGDSVKLADAVSSLLNDTRRTAQLVEAGHNRAEAFSMDSLADHYLALYHKIAGPITRSRRPRSDDNHNRPVDTGAFALPKA